MGKIKDLISRINILNMDILPKTKYIVNTFFLKIPNQFFTDHKITNLKFAGKTNQTNKQKTI